MAQALRDENRITTLLGTSNADGVTPVVIWADPATHRLLVDLPAGAGTVTSVSVVSANGLTGTVANATSTPAITLSTTVTGVLKGDGTTISAATLGTDYSGGTSALATGILKSTTSTGALTIAAAGDFPTLNQDTTGKSAKTDALNSATTVVNVSSATAPTLGQVLTATSGTAATWQTPASGFSNPMTTLGDIIIENSTPAPDRLAGNITATKKFLTQTGNGTISANPAWGTIAAGDVPTLNQSTTGSAASLSISGQTGLLSVTGLTSTNRIKTVRDAADTILELGGSYTPTGTWTSLTMVTPVLGTPASGTLTNCTFPTLNQNTSGTAANLSGTPALPNGTTVTTQSANDNSTKLATTAYADTNLPKAGGTMTGKTTSAGRDEVGKTYTPASGSQTVALDCSVNNMHIVTGNASGTAITFTITGATNSQPFIVSILQGGTTVSTIAGWFATIRWAGGTAPTLTATLNKRDTFGFIRTGTNTYDGFIIGQNA